METILYITVVYAKCRNHLRRPMQDRHRQQSANVTAPWYIIGDFNVITSVEEKIGGVPYKIQKSIKFISVIDECGLIDLGYHEPLHGQIKEVQLLLCIKD